jgi:tetratricopeptide (TPR) repeat protein
LSALRRSILIAAGLLVGVLAIRVAAVLAFQSSRPELARAIWPNHPGVQLSASLDAIGASAVAGHAPAPDVLEKVRAVARRDPLNPGPLLVEGTNAFAAGDLARAESLLLAASRLDPLAPASRFLLADLYFRQNRADPGLAQVGFLLERLNGNAAPLVPALAQFATQPGAAAKLRPVLARQPVVRGQVLALLADDPEHLPAILAIAPRREAPADAEWQQRLLSALVTRQDYAHAHALWRRFANVAAEPGRLFNPEFRAGGPPPPFNWRLTSGPAGTAEARSGGGLHLLYFGREDAVLADQLLLLPPGRYSLKFRVAGEPTGLGWALTCLPGTRRQDAILSQGRFDFVVPSSGCPAQRLELRGATSDNPRLIDVVLSPVSLNRSASE